MLFCLGDSKVAVRAAIASDLEDSFAAGSVIIDFGKTFLSSGGGIERFLALVFSNVAAIILNAGDLPLR